ncbi:MAG: hypothetical protein J7502_01685 [Flavisolibacter sp.]|nr:hypothetical protein [Flavisolibacter sp.]
MIISILFFLILTLSQCVEREKQVSLDPRGAAYAGADQCVACHKNISHSFSNTAHNKSSAPASDKTVKGNFVFDKNEYFYRPDVKVAMEQRDSGLYQVAYKNNIERQATRMDIAIGSGRKAQTYLYWYDDNVYQLPVSWFVPANSWVNSPGYPATQVRFDRNVPIGCFECHSSYIKLKSNEVVGSNVLDNLDRNQVIYGIDCERCHGPAAEHVIFHKEHPEEKSPRNIVGYSALTRQQKIDMCAQCHSGTQTILKTIFDFKPGDTLLNNFFAKSTHINVDELDVHGNQTQLLMASQCFIESKTLTCTSCHNTHVSERDRMKIFSQRCMNCHNQANHNFCSLASSSKTLITDNCIDCHMPAKPSKSITLLSNGQASPLADLVRTHYIKVYPEESKKFISVKK